MQYFCSADSFFFGLGTIVIIGDIGERKLWQAGGCRLVVRLLPCKESLVILHRLVKVSLCHFRADRADAVALICGALFCERLVGDHYDGCLVGVIAYELFESFFKVIGINF